MHLTGSHRPLRVLVGADTFPPDINGAARFGYRLAQGLASRGHEVHVACPATDAGPTVERDGGVTVHRRRSCRTGLHPTFRVCLPWHASSAARDLLTELEPDLVHVQAHFSIGRALARAASNAETPLVATNHFMPENLFGHARMPSWMHSIAARAAWRDLVRVFRPAQAVTAPTPRAVRLLHDKGLTQRATPVSCGIDLERYAGGAVVRPKVAGGQRTVLFVGRLDEEKRVDELLRAAALLPAWVRVELVGDGSRRDAWEALARSLGLADRVLFHGHVDDDALVAAYARCDVFCIPGVAELQSLVTLEAMASGKPIVAADAMALPHLVRPGGNGYLFPPGDVATLAERLITVLTDPLAAARMGAESRRMVSDHDIANTLDAFEALYRQVLGERPTAGASPGATTSAGSPASAVEPGVAA